MKRNRLSFLPGLGLLLAASAHAAVIMEPTRTFTVNSDVADFQNPPALFIQSINDSAILSLTKVEVGLHLVGSNEGGGFASEMYVSLSKDLSRTSILLNRVGVGDSNPVGQGYDGWNITLKDDAANGDIHSAVLGSGVLTGAWQPDGRSAPGDSARPSMLGTFNNQSANGAWRLAVGDLDLGGSMRLQSWSLTFAGETTVVPEADPQLVSVGLLALAVVKCWIRRREHGREAR